MRTIPRSYDTMLSYFHQHLSGTDHQVENLALWVYGLFKARSCHLGRIADELPLDGQRDSQIQRLKRWLMNPQIDPQVWYRRLLQSWLRHWPSQQDFVLILDRFEVADRFNVLLLAVAFRGRALPLTWEVLSHAGSCNFSEQQRLLDRILPDLPAQAPVALMGDSEFRSVELFTYALSQGWDYMLGHKGDVRILGDGLADWSRLDSLDVRPGKPVYLQGVQVTQLHAFGPVNLMAFWDEEDQCCRYRFTNRPANGYTLRWSRKRTWIEGLIRDFKSGGFHLDQTRLRHASRLNRLLLVMAIAVWWFVTSASRLIKEGKRRLIDTARRRTYTYFQIGLSWLKKQTQFLRPMPFECRLHI